MRGLRRLIHEIHRRSLWQVVGIYLIGSWIGYQVILALTHGLGMPDWLPALAFVLFVIGLPIVVATAFVNEGAPILRPRGTLLLADDETPLLRPEFAGEQESRAAGGRETSSPENAGRAHPLTWRRALSAGFAAFLVLGLSVAGYMGLRVAGVGPIGTLIAAGRIDTNAPIVLAEFRVASGDTLLARALTEALRVDLEQSRVVTLAQPTFVRDALRRMELDAQGSLDEATALELATRDGLAAVIAGDIAVAGGRWIVSARILEPASGAALASFRETADDSTVVLDALGRLSRKLRAKIGESLRDVRASEPLAQVTTPSLEALRLYSQAMRLSYLGNEHRDRVKAMLEQAVAIDTAFAMAYRKLAIEYRNDFYNPARAAEMMMKAYAHLDRLSEPERYMTIGSYHGTITFDKQQQLAAYETLAELYPTYPGALVNHSFALAQLRQRERSAEVLRRAIALDTTNALALSNLAYNLMALGRLEAADSLLDVFERRFPAALVVKLHRANLAFVRADYDAADALGEALVREATQASLRVSGLHTRYLAHATSGRLAAGEELMREARRVAERLGSANARYFADVFPAIVRLGTGSESSPALTARIDAVLARDPLENVPLLDRPYVELATFYARAGQPVRARALIAEYRALVPADRQRGNAWLPWAEAAIASAEGRPRDALALLRQAYDLDSCMSCYAPEIAFEFDRMEMPDSATLYWDRAVETLDFERRWDDAVWRGHALERLARIHDEAGRDEDARRYYARFIELWQGGDPVLQPRVEAARRRIAELMRG
jgi:eukaryotic-like serine/threonine-protein kinase